MLENKPKKKWLNCTYSTPASKGKGERIDYYGDDDYVNFAAKLYFQ